MKLEPDLALKRNFGDFDSIMTLYTVSHECLNWWISNIDKAFNPISHGPPYRKMVQNRLGFMHSVSLKSHGPVLLSMKLLPYPVNQSCFPSALDKLNERALRRMIPAVTSLAN